MLDFADAVAINKFERRGAEDARARRAPAAGAQPRGVRRRPGRDAGLRHQRGPVQRRRRDRAVPVPASASSPQHGLAMRRRGRCAPVDRQGHDVDPRRHPAGARRYLAEIAEAVRDYHRTTDEQAPPSGVLHALRAAASALDDAGAERGGLDDLLERRGARSRRAHAVVCSTAGRRPCATTAATSSWWPSATARSTRRCPARRCPATGAAGGAAPSRPTTASCVRFLRAENLPGAFPLHRRGVPVQARGRGPGPHVRRRGRRVPHQPPLQVPARPTVDGDPAVDGVRLGDPVRPRPRRAPDIYGKVGTSGVSIATLDDMKVLYDGFDLCVADHLGVDDDQRAGADHPGDVPQHRDRPAAGEVRRARPGTVRAEAAEIRAAHAARRCAAPCRPTSSRRTRARTPASSRPSSRCG